MVRKAEIPGHIIDTALELAARQGWRDLSLNDIAGAAGMPLSKVYPVYSSKQDILAALARRLDEQVLAEPPEDLDQEERARDRLFDVLMRRFDALNTHKAGIEAILNDVTRDPLSMLCGWPRLLRSMGWMLEAAGIDSGGPAGMLRCKGLALLWLRTLRDWLSDDSPDMAKTMAALDARLRRAESWAGHFTDRRRGKASESDATAAD